MAPIRSDSFAPLQSPDNPPSRYDREPVFDSILDERDVTVAMRDGVSLLVDVYRPDTTGKLPALLSFAIYNKDLQGPGMMASLPSQPAWSTLWAGLLEAGDTQYFVARGYVHVH